MAVIQLFARERSERERFGRLNADYRRALFGSTVWEASLYASVEALGSIALALLIWYGSGRIVADSLTFGALVAFIQYTNRFFLPIRDLGAKYTVMQWAMASSERIFGLLDRAPEIVSPAAAPRAARAVRRRRRWSSTGCGSHTTATSGSSATARSTSCPASGWRSSGRPARARRPAPAC